MTTHSVLAPSSASRWSVCTGSVSLCAQHGIDPDSPASVEGTLAHSHAEHWLRTGAPRQDMPQALREGVGIYVQDVTAHSEAPEVEVRLSLSAIHPDCFGTADALARHGKTIRLWDFKFGRVPVPVRNNLQLICYASGVAQPGDTVILTIVQPRVWHRDGPVHCDRLTYDDLQGPVAHLRQQAARALSDRAELVPGAHCRYCPGAHVCPVARRVLADYVQPAAAEIVPDLHIADELRTLREVQNLVNRRLEQLERDALGRLRAGARLPGCEVRPRAGRLHWTHPDQAVATMANLCGVTVTRLMTPQQALDSGVPLSLIEHYTERRHGALQVKTDANERAAEVFQHGD